ncbi:MAG TPA: carboxypeptidase-like regulatory domain-containing protein [Planctomycetaceae bacterium]
MKPGSLSAVLLLCALSGCSPAPRINYEKAGLVDVSGTVTMDGQPLVDALVLFETEEGRVSSGRTDADGRYVLRFNRQATGVIPGKKTVRISTGMAATEEEASTLRVETIPARYNTQSELEVEVKPGEDQTFDFALTSEGKVEQPEAEVGEEG